MGDNKSLADSEEQNICLATTYADKRARTVSKWICMTEVQENTLEGHGFSGSSNGKPDALTGSQLQY